MSWNIQKPGDYINGPLTVVGATTITGDLTVDTNVLKVNTTNNRVGILTASPESELDVRGLIAVRGTPTFPTTGVGPELFWSPGNSNSNLYSYNRGTSAWAEMAYGALNHNFQISGSTRMTLNSIGLNVGNAPNANNRPWALQGFGYINGVDGNGIEYRNSGTGNSGYITNDLDRLNFNFLNGVFVSQGNLRVASGNGIDFSLSPNAAGATSEILNDYEEGAWTATLRGAGEPGNLAQNTGRYTKIGRQVTVQVAFENVDTTGYSGAIRISGLPFTNSIIRTMGSAGTFLGSTFSQTQIVALTASDTSLEFMDIKSNAVWTASTHFAGSGRYFWATLTYTVA